MSLCGFATLDRSFLEARFLFYCNHGVVVQLLSHIQLFVTLWAAARQASLSFTVSWSLLRLMSIESVMPSNHLVLCRAPLLLPSILPSIRGFSNESALCVRWPSVGASASALQLLLFLMGLGQLS